MRGRAPRFDAIAFNYFEGTRRCAAAAGRRAQLVYRLDINEYQGERRLQLLVEHVVQSVWSRLLAAFLR